MSGPTWSWDRSHEGSLGIAPDRPGWFHGHRLAIWPWRVAAGIIDYGPPLVVWGLISQLNNTLAWLVAGSMALFNSGFLAARTTQSLGKRVFGIRLVQVRKGPHHEVYVAYVPIWVGLVRVPLHYLDFLPCGLGFLLPIMNKSKATIADMLTRTVNFRDPRLPSPQHIVGPTDWV